MFSSELEEICDRFAGQPFALDGVGKPVTYAEAFGAVLAFSERLVQAGVRPGNLVSVEIRDPLAFSLVRFALLRIGALSAALKITAGLQISGPPPDFVVREISQAELSANEIIFDASWIRKAEAVVPVHGEGYVVTVSSGTTGKPKLSLRSDAAHLARVKLSVQQRDIRPTVAFIGYRTTASPFLSNLSRSILSGAMNLFPMDNAAETLAQLRKFDCSHIFVPPVYLAMFVQAAKDNPLPNRLERISTGGGAISSKLAAAAEALFDCEVVSTYGTNETGPIAHARMSEEGSEPGVFSSVYEEREYRFIDETGAEVANDVGGQLQIRQRADMITLSYPDRNPVADERGWISTGDIARVLPDGRLKLEGRIAEFINIGGAKNLPGTFEEVARSFAGVREVTAFRAPIDGGIEHVGLAVVPEDEFDLQAFGQFMMKELGPNYPIQVTVVRSTPRTPAGKVDRAALTRDFEDHIATVIAAANKEKSEVLH